MPHVLLELILEFLIGFDVPEFFAFVLSVHFQAVFLRARSSGISHGPIPAVVVQLAIFVYFASIIFAESLACPGERPFVALDTAKPQIALRMLIAGLPFHQPHAFFGSSFIFIKFVNIA